MTELLTAAQTRALEAVAIAAGAVTGLELMERAGRGVVEAVLAEWPELAEEGARRAVVLCGPGNNGGDGFVVARLLTQAGWVVEVFLYGDADRLPPDARVNHDRWASMGEVRPIADLPSAWAQKPLLVDALFGIGLSRPLPDSLTQLLRRLRGPEDGTHLRRYDRSVAVDVPSGLDADSGKSIGGHGAWDWSADLTVTFLRAKVGHHLADGPARSGKLVVRDLGLERERFFERGLLQDPEDDRRVALTDRTLFGVITPFMRQLAKTSEAHKFRHGHALILSGGVGRGGAARLAARGALRIGAGLVTVACPPAALIENAAHLDAVMLRAVRDAPALAAVLEDRRITALCIGPGLGVARAAEMLAVALPLRRDMVIDADGLTALAADPALFARLYPGCILTPHGGEFARLFPDIAARLDAPAMTGPACSKVDATRDAASRAGCVVLHKGPDTVIADPQGRCSISSAAYDRAAPWLATAGSGDVLAGFIAGLLARGFDPMQAAETAAWLHVEAARAFGPGLIAEDLPEMLPRVFRALGI